MMYCTPEARAACPTGHLCEPRPTFADDSDCARFNAQIAAGLEAEQASRFGKIRQMSIADMVELLMTLDDCEHIQYCDGHCIANGMTIEKITHEMCKECMIRHLQAEGEILAEVD